MAGCSQRWVHVGADLRLSRASPELLRDFAPESGEDSLRPPRYQAHEAERVEHRMPLTCWQTWTDPLGHVNHPAYVDWFDEAIARVVAPRGVDPARVVPVAEWVKFSAEVRPGDEVTILTRAAGLADAGTVVDQRVVQGERVLVHARLVRRVLDEPVGALDAALG